jgi:lysozyme
MAGAVRAEGIDVSHWQEGLDWAKIAAGVQFAWLKVSYGASGRDDQYTRHQKAARAAGVPVGGYHWAHPEENPDPKVEADNFIGRLKFAPGDLRPALDFEEPKAQHMRPAFLERWALGWLKYVEKQLGVKPVLYINPNWLANVLRGAPRIKQAQVDIWLADYGPDDGTRHRVHSAASPFAVVAHQYTSKGRVPGWSKGVDRNYTPDLTALVHQPPAPGAKSRPPWIAVIGGKKVKGRLTDAAFIATIRASLEAGAEVTLRPRKPGE